MMSSRPRRFTSSGGFGSTHGFEEGESPAEEISADPGEDLDIDFSITESGRTVAHLIANMKDQSEDMEFSFTDSGRSTDAAPSTKPTTTKSHVKEVGAMTRGRSGSRAIQGSVSTTTEQQQSGSYESSGSAFVSGLMTSNAGQGGLSHTPPSATSYETRHFGKRPRAGVSRNGSLFCDQHGGNP